MRILALACLGLAMSQLGSGVYIQLKASLAQQLIARAWEQPGPARPWPWADTWPIARLAWPARGESLYVLSGGRGNALAFGPAHDPASSAPGEPGITLISGHRDTHFGFLGEVETGEEIHLTASDGRLHRYLVTETRIADSRRGPLRAAGDGILLVTCYPFDAISAGGPLRYIVVARPLL
jgi:sortase A